MYTTENHLLHLNPGCQLKRDFCHHKRDSQIPFGVADFYNGLHQKYDKNHENHYQERRGRGGGREGAHPVCGGGILYSAHSFHMMLVILHDNIMTDNMTELIIKFCHHNRDVRPPSPSPPLPLLIMIFIILIILLMQTIIKICHLNRDFDCPDCGGKNPD